MGPRYPHGGILQPALPHESSSPLALRTHHPHPRRSAPSSHHQLYPEISTHYSLSKGLSHDTLSPTLAAHTPEESSSIHI